MRSPGLLRLPAANPRLRSRPGARSPQDDEASDAVSINTVMVADRRAARLVDQGRSRALLRCLQRPGRRRELSSTSATRATTRIRRSSSARSTTASTTRESNSECICRPAGRSPRDGSWRNMARRLICFMCWLAARVSLAGGMIASATVGNGDRTMGEFWIWFFEKIAHVSNQQMFPYHYTNVVNRIEARPALDPTAPCLPQVGCRDGTQDPGTRTVRQSGRRDLALGQCAPPGREARSGLRQVRVLAGDSPVTKRRSCTWCSRMLASARVRTMNRVCISAMLTLWPRQKLGAALIAAKKIGITIDEYRGVA